jgi:hypothetical protein
MSKTHSFLRIVASVVVSTMLAACGETSHSTQTGGSGSPTGPSPGSSTTDCSKVSVLGSAKGKIEATVGGATFNGGVAGSNANYTEVPAVPSLGIPAQDFITLLGVCGDGSQLTITAPAKTGVQQIGLGADGKPIADPVTKQPLTYMVRFQYVRNGTAAEAYFASLVGGTGSITVNAVSKSGASGSFNVNMVKQDAVGGAGIGNLAATGTFNVTF